MEHETLNKIEIGLPSIVGKQYDVVVGANLDGPIIPFLQKQDNISNIVIITDSNVRDLYGESLLTELKQNLKSYTLNLISFQEGEQYKTQKTVTELQNEMFRLKCGRDTFVVALGGGVVGDVAGFVAATYMRGIPYIQVPTTTLAMVDSSVGGKTGIDNEFGKNLVGAFHQPEVVFADVQVLQTLPKEHLVSGLVEAVKMFLTHDTEGFKYVQDNYEDIINFDLDKLQKIIARAVEIKSGVVMRDEKESNERRILNFGHTIGHAIEKLSNYNINHGYAVGLGVLVEAKVAELAGKLSGKDYAVIEKLFCRMVDKRDISKFDSEQILQETRLDKKVQGGNVKYVLLQSIGQVYIGDNQFAHDIDENIVLQALNFFRE